MIARPLAKDERISLITAIFSDRDETEAVKALCGDHAQAFVDAVDQVILSHLEIFLVTQKRVSHF